MMSIVSIAKGNDPEVMVKEAIELLGGLTAYVKPEQRVFIKPNVCGGVPGKPGSFTSIQVMAATIKLLREVDAKISVGEADSCMYTADVMLKKTGIHETVEKRGADVVNLSKGEMVTIDVLNGYQLENLSVQKVVSDADAIISMPVMKTHMSTVVTLGVKTMFGVLPRRKKSRYHPKLDQVLVDIISVLNPRLTIIDSITAMEGEGPFKGDLVDLGLIIAGNNVVSTDACAAYIMGFDPVSIDHLRLASEKGLGTINIDEIEIRGEQIDAVKRPFAAAKQEKRERLLSRLSTQLGYYAIHRVYEDAVSSWKQNNE